MAPSNVVSATRAIEKMRVLELARVRRLLRRHPKSDEARLKGLETRLSMPLAKAIRVLSQDPENAGAWTERGEIQQAIEEADSIRK